MLKSLNVFITKWMPLLTPLSLVIGVFLKDIGGHLLFLIPFLFAFMTLTSSLSMNINDIKGVKKYPKLILFSIAFLHIIMPIWAYFLSNMMFDDHLLIIGFTLSVAVPTGVTSIIWINISRGNLPLGLSIILIDTLLAPFVMPLLIKIIAGKAIAIDTTALILDLLWMIVLPSIVGIVLNEWSKGRIQKVWGPRVAPFSKMCIFAIVMINGSVLAPYLSTINGELIRVIGVVLLLATTGYIFSLVIGHFLWKDLESVATFLFTGGMRNIAVGVVIATTYFPSKVAMPIVFGMLFQQLLASIFHKIFESYRIKVEK